MIIEHTPTQPDGGGSIRVVAETAEEVADLVAHYDRGSKMSELDKARKMLVPPPVERMLLPRPENNRAWYEVRGATPAEFLEPYLALLDRLTGFKFEGAIPIIKIAPDAFRIGHTNHTGRLWIEDCQFHYVILVSASDWNKRTAAEYAQELADRYMGEMIARRPPVEQYISLANGQFEQNPKYATGYKHRLEAATISNDIWRALLDWWYKNKANDWQKDIAKRAQQLRGSGPYRGIAGHDFDLSGYSPIDPAGLRIQADKYDVRAYEWTGKGTYARTVKWEEFRLGGVT